MNQTEQTAKPVGDHNELMAGAIHHLRNAMETGSRRSCAVACMLFACLGRSRHSATSCAKNAGAWANVWKG